MEKQTIVAFLAGFLLAVILLGGVGGTYLLVQMTRMEAEVRELRQKADESHTQSDRQRELVEEAQAEALRQLRKVEQELENNRVK